MISPSMSAMSTPYARADSDDGVVDVFRKISEEVAVDRHARPDVQSRSTASSVLRCSARGSQDLTQHFAHRRRGQPVLLEPAFELGVDERVIHHYQSTQRSPDESVRYGAR